LLSGNDFSGCFGRSFSARLEMASKAARIDPAVNLHALRHTYASRLAMRGLPLAVIAKQLGHADTLVEKHYGHLAPSYVAETVRAAFGTLGIVEPSSLAADQQRAVSSPSRRIG
jgi:integrase